VGIQLWFNQFLQGEFNMPQTPKGTLELNAADHVPSFSVTPDPSHKIRSVMIYYTQDGAGKPSEKLWRAAKSTEQAGTWTAQLPLPSIANPLWVYADVNYALEQTVESVGYSGGAFKADSFHLASVVEMLSQDALKAAGVKATMQLSDVMETVEQGG